jgi:allantoinase
MTESDSSTSNTNWRWPDNARLAVSLVVNVEEGSELTLADGDRGPDPVDELGIAMRSAVRNYGNESNYRYGINAGVPRVMALLRRYGVTATFAAAALSLERAPALAKAIADEGHEACSHGWRWIHQHRFDEAAEREFINKAVESIDATTGTRPYGWLSRYLHTERTRQLLAEAGFEYHMDDYSDDVPFWDAGVSPPMVVLPYALDSNDMKMWTAPALTPADWLQYAIDTFECLYEEGTEQPRMMSLGLHLRIIGRPGRISYLDRFLRHITAREDVWIASRIDIARHFAQVCPSPPSSLPTQPSQATA